MRLSHTLGQCGPTHHSCPPAACLDGRANALAPYVATSSEEAARSGLPLQQALFLGREDDLDGSGIETPSGYGRDLIGAPVIWRERSAHAPHLADLVDLAAA